MGKCPTIPRPHSPGLQDPVPCLAANRQFPMKAASLRHPCGVRGLVLLAGSVDMGSPWVAAAGPACLQPDLKPCGPSEGLWSELRPRDGVRDVMAFSRCRQTCSRVRGPLQVSGAGPAPRGTQAQRCRMGGSHWVNSLPSLAPRFCFWLLLPACP